MKYGITYKIELFANFAIEAESERDALRIADELLESDEFREDRLIPEFDEPLQWGDALYDCKVTVDNDCDYGYRTLDTSDYIEE